MRALLVGLARLAGLVLFGSFAAAAGCGDDDEGDVCLTIHSDVAGDRQLCRSVLLARRDVREVRLADVGFYRSVGPLSVKAVPLAAVLGEPWDAGDVLDFRGADGFSAPLNPERMLRPRPSGATAYLAVEEAGAPWPPLGEGRPSAGPFAIVWTDAGGGDVSSEEWPYQVVAIHFAPPLSERYPDLVPARTVPEDDPVRRGLEVFVDNCMPCHRLNGAGEAEMGPDLNRPMSPMEYMTEDGFRRLVRDPRSVRAWPASQMPATSEEQVPDEDLDALIAYLSHMSARRP